MKKTLAESSQEFHDALVELRRILILEPFTRVDAWLMKLIAFIRGYKP